jgi:hypothetical protein
MPVPKNLIRKIKPEESAFARAVFQRPLRKRQVRRSKKGTSLFGLGQTTEPGLGRFSANQAAEDGANFTFSRVSANTSVHVFPGRVIFPKNDPISLYLVSFRSSPQGSFRIFQVEGPSAGQWATISEDDLSKFMVVRSDDGKVVLNLLEKYPTPIFEDGKPNFDRMSVYQPVGLIDAAKQMSDDFPSSSQFNNPAAVDILRKSMLEDLVGMGALITESRDNAAIAVDALNMGFEAFIEISTVADEMLERVFKMTNLVIEAGEKNNDVALLKQATGMLPEFRVRAIMWSAQLAHAAMLTWYTYVLTPNTIMMDLQSGIEDRAPIFADLPPSIKNGLAAEGGYDNEQIEGFQRFFRILGEGRQGKREARLKAVEQEAIRQGTTLSEMRATYWVMPRLLQIAKEKIEEARKIVEDGVLQRELEQADAAPLSALGVLGSLGTNGGSAKRPKPLGKFNFREPIDRVRVAVRAMIATATRRLSAAQLGEFYLRLTRAFEAEGTFTKISGRTSFGMLKEVNEQAIKENLQPADLIAKQAKETKDMQVKKQLTILAGTLKAASVAPMRSFEEARLQLQQEALGDKKLQALEDAMVLALRPQDVTEGVNIAFREKISLTNDIDVEVKLTTDLMGITVGEAKEGKGRVSTAPDILWGDWLRERGRLFYGEDRLNEVVQIMFERIDKQIAEAKERVAAAGVGTRALADATELVTRLDTLRTGLRRVHVEGQTITESMAEVLVDMSANAKLMIENPETAKTATIHAGIFDAEKRSKGYDTAGIADDLEKLQNNKEWAKTKEGAELILALKGAARRVEGAAAGLKAGVSESLEKFKQLTIEDIEQLGKLSDKLIDNIQQVDDLRTEAITKSNEAKSIAEGSITQKFIRGLRFYMGIPLKVFAFNTTNMSKPMITAVGVVAFIFVFLPAAIVMWFGPILMMTILLSSSFLGALAPPVGRAADWVLEGVGFVGSVTGLDPDPSRGPKQVTNGGPDILTLIGLGVGIGFIVAPKTVIPAITGFFKDIFSFVTGLVGAGKKRKPGRKAGPAAARKQRVPGRPLDIPAVKRELEAAKAVKDVKAEKKIKAKLQRAKERGQAVPPSLLADIRDFFGFDVRI